MFIVVKQVNGWDDFVMIFDTFAKARRWIGTSDFSIIECKVNKQDWNYVFIRGMSKNDLEAFNTIKPRKYVKTNKEQYSLAMKQLNKVYTVEEIAKKLNKPVQFVKYYVDHQPVIKSQRKQ